MRKALRIFSKLIFKKFSTEIKNSEYWWISIDEGTEVSK